MARPGLEKNVKFKRLLRRLNLPKPYVRGLLETMWDVAHESGNPVLGPDAEAVEAAAEWPGSPGVFFEAVKTDWLDHKDGKWEIHDYWHHAPEYVAGRAAKERERLKEKHCEKCGKPYRNPDFRSKYCSLACRVAKCRNPVTDVTDPSVTSIAARYGPLQSVTPSTRGSLHDPSKSSDTRNVSHIFNKGLSDVTDVTEASVTVTDSNGPPSPSPSPCIGGGAATSEDLDTRIAKFIQSHRWLPTYDVRQHGQCKTLIELVGWTEMERMILEVRKDPRVRSPLAVALDRVTGEQSRTMAQPNEAEEAKRILRERRNGKVTN